ncbi:hypothetical protein B0J11DRAFT_512960 [Dendryphion nanum]|uniref:Uncharacterized protein n=1 Tax=Dendryphion nanum TaxID=256645 RepID=A0A9P9CYB8_9PLEO|nr:hypothetical protein B0J11DRAFT_512960 [Dendryphion nanum]
MFGTAPLRKLYQAEHAAQDGQPARPLSSNEGTRESSPGSSHSQPMVSKVTNELTTVPKSTSSSTSRSGIEYVIYLINAVKFHSGQLMHLFDEEGFMVILHGVYFGVENSSGKDKLWYIHSLLIIAFGKTFVRDENRSAKPPSAEFFTKGLQLLPDINSLRTDPMRSIGMLCCKALYLKALDSRNAAYATTDMPAAELGETAVQ